MSSASSIGDRWNPILVKEVRAALRGRVFRIVFPIVVLGAVVVAMLQLSSLDPVRDGNIGRQFVAPIYFMLCMTMLGIVPLSAFFSMGGEWEEHTFDLLSISNLRPRHIVWGKLFSAGVEATLYFSAFVPLLVFAFLLRGIDIVTLLIVLGLTYLASFAMAAVALAFSSLARVRVARILVLCLVAAACVGAIALAFEMAEEFLFRTWRGSSPLDWRVSLTAVLFILGFLFGGVTVACERLAHPEENHSTGPRVFVTLLLTTWVVCWVSMYIGSSRSAGFLPEPIMAGLVLVAFAHVFFVTEREDMTRRAAHGVPKSRLLALCSLPFLPGGGRALILFALHTLLAITAIPVFLALSSFGTAASGLDQRAMSRIGVLAAHLFVYLALLSWISHRRAEKPAVRWVTRLAIPTVVLLVVCVPAFALYMLGERTYPDFEHAFNPFMGLARNSSLPLEQRVLIALAFLIVVLLNVPRVAQAIREVLLASRANRDRVRGS